MNNRRPVLYILAGIYLLYIDYTLIKNWATLENKMLFVIFMIVFGLIGGGLVVHSAWKLLKDKNSQNDSSDTMQDNDNMVEQKEDEEASNSDESK